MSTSTSTTTKGLDGCSDAPSSSTKSDIPIPKESTNKDEPKLTAFQLRQANRLADRMEGFHNHFRHLFRSIYKLADNYEEEDYNTREFISYADQLHQYLGLHHNIEEEYVFPVLAERMPEFRDEHPQSHRAIHDGLDRYEAYLDKCRKDPSKLDPAELKALMESFEQVLFKHLDEEVQSLRWDNIKKYWTLEELRNIPM
ncbi:hypothetical protein BT69DRAFT_1355996 [Atractiella rhizophila]|nr:hypothetical protein BT69DRAFT_1355996 [Atractiella rhizophila]